MNRRDEVCIHEAGHAVCAALLGKHYGCAVHGAGAGTGGLAGSGDLSAPATNASYTPDRCAATYAGDSVPDLMNDACISAAGAAAVALALCEMNVLVSSADRNLIGGACRIAFPEADYQAELAFVNLAVCRARALLNADFRRVERVAAELGRRGLLSADDVARLVFPEMRAP